MYRMEVASVSGQAPGRVFAAIKGEDGSFVDAVTLRDEHGLKADEINDVEDRWRRDYGIPGLPSRLEEIRVPVTDIEIGGKHTVKLSMCTRGMGGCHRLFLCEGVSLTVRHELHEGGREVVLGQVYAWADQLALTGDEKFWFVAAAMARHHELCNDPRLDWTCGLPAVFCSPIYI